MLLLQTAFDPEFAAVSAAGSRVASASEPTITIAGRTCQLLMTGIGPRAARKQLAVRLDRIEPPDLVLSIGLAGGLLPQLQFGQPILIGSVQTSLVGRPSQAVHPSIPIAAHLDRLSSNLRERMSVHNLLTLQYPALTVASKRQWSEQTGAQLCDMETYAVADECRQRQLPWIGARVISDTANDSIAAWIIQLPRLIKQKRWLRLLRSVATHPQDFPGLIRLALRMQRLKPILTQLTIDLVTHVL